MARLHICWGSTHYPHTHDIPHEKLVGKENAIAGTDRGLQRVAHASVQWAKFRAVVEGATVASQRLWGAAVA